LLSNRSKQMQLRTMKYSIVDFLLLFVTLFGTSHGFSTSRPIFVAPMHSRAVGHAVKTRRCSRTSSTCRHAESLLGTQTLFTPDGYGFSTDAARILREAKRQGGYHKASASDRVVDVMDAITSGVQDVALVFDSASPEGPNGTTQNLLGLFTETDYIRVRLQVFLCVNALQSTSSSLSFV